MQTRQLDKINPRYPNRVYVTKTNWYCNVCSYEDDIFNYNNCRCYEKKQRETSILGNVSHSTGEQSEQMIKRIETEKRLQTRREDKLNDYAFQKQLNTHFKEIECVRKLSKKGKGVTLENLNPGNMFIGNEIYQNYVETAERVKIYEKMLKEGKDVSKSLKGSIAYWITISPPEEEDPAKLFKLMDELQETTMFKDTSYWCYAYEWRKHDEPGGFHVHLIIDRRDDNKEPNKDKRTVTNMYKKVYGFNATTISVCMYGIKSEVAKERKVSYIKGEKQESKRDKVLGDKMLRMGYGLEQFYES